ncbi:hypothetical protein AJ79_06091 [Helicocarpus griseus UAMH5409]|uniref:Uncharacterized protein n=1 Tax=Helicocarpus griseus UAMH5409 TaxID=1447875 RepID=A0A2B7XH37_9EURO|nr:hypothetical protein AJ79_06091 [Helicocarpus griseus UAMH5409]
MTLRPGQLAILAVPFLGAVQARPVEREERGYLRLRRDIQDVTTTTPTALPDAPETNNSIEDYPLDEDSVTTPGDPIPSLRLDHIDTRQMDKGRDEEESESVKAIRDSPVTATKQGKPFGGWKKTQREVKAYNYWERSDYSYSQKRTEEENPSQKAGQEIPPKIGELAKPLEKAEDEKPQKKGGEEKRSKSTLLPRDPPWNAGGAKAVNCDDEKLKNLPPQATVPWCSQAEKARDNLSKPEKRGDGEEDAKKVSDNLSDAADAAAAADLVSEEPEITTEQGSSSPEPKLSRRQHVKRAPGPPITRWSTLRPMAFKSSRKRPGLLPDKSAGGLADVEDVEEQLQDWELELDFYLDSDAGPDLGSDLDSEQAPLVFRLGPQVSIRPPKSSLGKRSGGDNLPRSAQLVVPAIYYDWEQSDEYTKGQFVDDDSPQEEANTLAELGILKDAVDDLKRDVEVEDPRPLASRSASGGPRRCGGRDRYFPELEDCTKFKDRELSAL